VQRRKAEKILPKKIDLRRRFSTARVTESEIALAGRKFSGVGARLKNDGASGVSPT
jgi:hypothetical protein